MSFKIRLSYSISKLLNWKKNQVKIYKFCFLIILKDINKGEGIKLEKKEKEKKLQNVK